MTTKNFRPLKDVAHGHWEFLMQHFGLGEYLRFKKFEGPCPLCSTDAKSTRFRFTDRFGYGDYFCSKCGAGDGIGLLMKYQGCDFKKLVADIHEALGTDAKALPTKALPTDTSCKPQESDERARKNLVRVWEEAKPIQPGDAADRYLSSRYLGMPEYPAAMRLHPGLKYFDEPNKKELGKFPTLLSIFRHPAGPAVTLHRTYLTEKGEKAPVPKVKKMMSPVRPMAGGAVRLFDPQGDCLAVAEGIETALAVRRLTRSKANPDGCPVWAATSASLLMTMKVPESVKKVWIFADLDVDIPDQPNQINGQRAAKRLSERLVAEGKEVVLYRPDSVEEDFHDVYLRTHVLVAA
ncbi:MAG: toprim domain-containing protein [Rhodocyclaceae bacterium]|nr:toprim domain-containing protein [Rhodocyclaceae bacterium]